MLPSVPRVLPAIWVMTNDSHLRLVPDANDLPLTADNKWKIGINIMDLDFARLTNHRLDY